MHPGQKKFVRFLGKWAINTLAVAVAVELLGKHIICQPWYYLLIASFLLGLLNAFIRPILLLLALPLVILTLGLFTLVINALLLRVVGLLLAPNFQVDTFWSAFLGALIISIISIALNAMTGNARITIRRGPPRRPPPGKDDDDVIDV
ncbi:MAG TPA: phage holin family protein [Verrucomicrobiae bacterium]|jgi:putative membrane protein